MRGTAAVAGRFEAVSCFETYAVDIAIGSETKKDEALYLYMACEGKVEVANLSGSVSRTMTLGEADGSPTHVDIHGTSLVVGTSRSLPPAPGFSPLFFFLFRALFRCSRWDSKAPRFALRLVECVTFSAL